MIDLADVDPVAKIVFSFSMLCYAMIAGTVLAVLMGMIT